MSSYDVGKDAVVDWIRKNFKSDSIILDMGACDGKWKKLLPEYTMDAVEIWKPSCIEIEPLYRYVFHRSIPEFQYNWYDLIIFGDVVEHMPVETAQRCIRYALDRCRDLIVSVPYLYEQYAVGGNPWQVHKQSDLTADIFSERYPELKVLYDTGNNYCYYHRRYKSNGSRNK